jgi:starch synthase
VKILFAASEVYPFAKTGGLADVTGSLPKSLLADGHEVSLIMPRYGCIKAQGERIGDLRVPMGGGKTESASIERIFLDPANRIPVYLVDHPAYFGKRDELYGHPDDGWRFAFYCRSVLEAIRSGIASAEVVHCHDWHAGLVPAYLAALGSGDPILSRIRAIFTIHNLKYQGVFGREVFAYSGLPWSMYGIEGLEYYGDMNFLKAGIVYSTMVNTVSPTYSKEIQSPEFGNGLHGLLQHHAAKLLGIINGIDDQVWNPEADPSIVTPFSRRDPSGKELAKLALQEECGLPGNSAVPLLAFIGRLVDQKGMDIIMPILPKVLERAQVVVLGTGDLAYHQKLQALNGKGRSNLALFLKYDESLAHRIYAGSDALLMPSWFEPCGLGQLIALRYGTLPIVRSTGGLADSVRDADEDRSGGTGFSFTEYRADRLLDAIERSLRAFDNRARWAELVGRAMSQDFSWSSSTKKYEELYRSALQ